MSVRKSVIIDTKKMDERSDFELELEAAISKQPTQRQAKHNVTKLILAQYRKILAAKNSQEYPRIDQNL